MLHLGNLAGWEQRSRPGLRPPRVGLPRPLVPLDSPAPRVLRLGLLQVARSLVAVPLPPLRRVAVLLHSPVRVASGLWVGTALAAASFPSPPRRQARLVQVQVARVSSGAAEVPLGAVGMRLGAAQAPSAHSRRRVAIRHSLPRAQPPRRALVSAPRHLSWERLSKQTLPLPMTMRNPAARVDLGLEASVYRLMMLHRSRLTQTTRLKTKTWMRRPLRSSKKSQNLLYLEHLNRQRKPEPCSVGSLKNPQHQRRRPPHPSSSQLTPRPRNLIHFLAKPVRAVLLDPRLPNPVSLDPATTQASQNKRPTLLRRCQATNPIHSHRRLRTHQTPSHRRTRRQKPQRPQKMRLCRRNQQVRPNTHLEIPRLLP